MTSAILKSNVRDASFYFNKAILRIDEISFMAMCLSYGTRLRAQFLYKVFDFLQLYIVDRIVYAYLRNLARAKIIYCDRSPINIDPFVFYRAKKLHEFGSLPTDEQHFDITWYTRIGEKRVFYI